MKNVLLIGVGGLYNYGCEAIVRGTIEILKNTYPSIEISYASYNYEDDIKRLSDCNINIINRPRRKRWNYHNVIRKILSYFNRLYIVPFDSIEWVKGFDTLFSIGGDMYTLNANGEFDRSLPLFCERCASLGLKYILWGASVGKFENNPQALEFFKAHLLKVDLIAAREINSVEYLRMIGVFKNVCLVPDPAYFVASEIMVRDKTSKKMLGINLSPLSVAYQYPDIEIAIAKQAYSISNYIDILDVDVLLLPHVLSPHYVDNDLQYLIDVYNKIPDKYRDRVHIVDTDPGFIGLKQFIMKCDFVIAARMHCAINAISSGIPALFLAYSEKARGMSNFAYGSDTPVISLLDFENIPLVENLLAYWNYSVDLEGIRGFNFKEII